MTTNGRGAAILTTMLNILTMAASVWAASVSDGFYQALYIGLAMLSALYLFFERHSLKARLTKVH